MKGKHINSLEKRTELFTFAAVLPMIIKRIMKAVGGILAVVAILLVAAVLLIDTDTVQNWLMQRAVAMLNEELKTDVTVGHVSVSLAKRSVTLTDVEIDDRQGRRMLRVGQLSLGLDLAALWRSEVVVTTASATGVKAQLCKPASQADSTANYQFLVDTFKGRKSQHHDSTTPQLHDSSTPRLLPPYNV